MQTVHETGFQLVHIGYAIYANIKSIITPTYRYRYSRSSKRQVYQKSISKRYNE